MRTEIIELKHIEQYPQLEFGGKARNLAKLIKAGISVPDAWVVPEATFRQHLAWSKLENHALSVAERPEVENCQTMRQRIFKMELSVDLLKSFSQLPDVSLAVRSSASVEDSARASYSGLFETCLGIHKGEGLADAIKQVWASVFTPEVLTYHRQITQSGPYPSMAVLIMPLLEAQTAGVVFSAHPADGNPFQIVINACLGLATTVVDGNETCQRYLLDFDKHDVLEVDCGQQQTGDFVGKDGRVERKSVTQDHLEDPILTDEDICHLAESVRSIDETFDGRVDVEFAFHSGRLAILQARPVLGLPPYFPDNPADKNENVFGLGHDFWTDPLPPFLRAASSITHSEIPPPPWPVDFQELFFHHGRLYARTAPEPEIPSWEDRTFLECMQNLDDPEDYFKDWWPWVRDAYQRLIPSMRSRAEETLALSEDELTALSQQDLARSLDDMIDLETEARAFYFSAAEPTSDTLTYVQALASDWLMDGDWKQSDMFAVNMVQGSHKLTHTRDAELQAMAWGEGDLESFTIRWGYSYLTRGEELFAFHRWKSWREDPKPLLTAIEQMRNCRVRLPIQVLVQNAAEESRKALDGAVQQLKASNPVEGKKRAEILKACVKACRVHYPMKDDRDIVLCHAQSALRWILMEADRRLRKVGSSQNAGDVFMFEPHELVDWLSSRRSSCQKFAKILEERRREQARLGRYTLPRAEPTAKVDLPTGDVLEGQPASAGIAEGRACVVCVDAYEDISKLEEGNILVLKGDGKVGWTMFFTNIAGLVYSGGNWLSHETTLCRELGKPAVVGLVEEIELIEDGELLRIDGAEGTVLLLEREG